MVIPYYIVVNIIAFLMYGADKYFAKKDMWRISEKALLGIAAIGGGQNNNDYRTETYSERGGIDILGG